MDKKNNAEQKVINNSETIPETKISTVNEKNQINFQNNNILINIENLSLINPGKEKIKIINNNNTSNNNNEDEKNKNKSNISSGILEEKLETIFLEKEKAKLKYNKQELPETLKYCSSSDEEPNMSTDSKNKKIGKKESDNNEKKSKEDKKNDSPKKDNKEINEIKSFTRKRYNKNNNDEEKQDKNMYQMLLSKKIKNFIEDIDDEENNKDEEKKNEIEKNESKNIENNKAETQSLNLIISQEKDSKKELVKNEKDNKKEEKEEKEKEKEEKEKTEKLNENNLKESKKEENTFKPKDNHEQSINKNNDSYKEEDVQYSPTFCSKNHEENILNKNLEDIKDIKDNQLLNAEKSINLIDSIFKKKENKENNNIDKSADKKNMPYKHKIDLKNINEKLKTFNKNSNSTEINEEKEEKEKPKEKSNIMDLLKRIKNKKSEREQIDKETEKAKEEMYKRPKSQVGTRNIESFRKLKSHSKEENEINIEVSNNTRNKKTPLGSPKPEIYNRKALNDSINKNIFYTSNKVNENYKTQNQSPKSVDLVKDNSELSSSKNINRIVVNPRVRKKILEKKNINNFKNIDLKNNENPKNLSNIYSATYINRINKTKNLNQINCKKTYERPIFIYNKHKLQNRSLYTDTNESYNFLSTNILNTNSKNKIIRINLPNNIYNPRKPQTEKINSMDKFKRDKNNLMNSEYYGYNFTNFNDISQNNIYSKKKSILLDSNNEGNKSSYHISKSNKYNLNNYKINSTGVSPPISSQYSLIQKNNNNVNKEVNLKVNRKSFYKSKRQNSINESSDLSQMNIRNFISDNFNKKNYNDKSLDKYDSFLNKNNVTIKSYKNNVNNQISNSNQHTRKLGLQKFARAKKDILFNFNDEYEDTQSLKRYYNKNKFIKKMTINNSEEIFNTRKIKNTQKKLNLFKIEDLLIFEEKLNSLLECLKNIKETNKQCFDLWNFFFNSSIIKKIERIFDNEKEMNIAKYSINYELISIIVCYEYCTDQDAYIETNSKLLEIMELNYNNLMRLFQQVINNMEDENQNNPWIKKLFNIFENYSKKENFFIYNDDILSVSGKIKHNNENISLKIQNILNYYRTENNSLLMNYYVQLKTKTYEDLNYLFQNEILEIENEEGSLIASLYLKDNTIFPPVSPPYLKTPNYKKYTLVLDLNETLVNFKIKKGREGYVRLRPFLFGFLEEVSQYYELIIFTLATEAYTNSVIGAIENDKKYFDYIFYRQHAIIVDLNTLVKLTFKSTFKSTFLYSFRYSILNSISIYSFCFIF